MGKNFAIPGSSKNGYILVTFSLRTAVEIVSQMFRFLKNIGSLKLLCVRTVSPFRRSAESRLDCLYIFLYFISYLEYAIPTIDSILNYMIHFTYI